MINQLVAIFGPFIGDAMVRASAKGHWDKLGLGAEADLAGIRALMDALGPGLNVFVGKAKGESLVAEARRALGDTEARRRA